MIEYDAEIAEASGLPADELLALVSDRLASGGIRDDETRAQAVKRTAMDILSERYEAEVKRRRGNQ